MVYKDNSQEIIRKIEAAAKIALEQAGEELLRKANETIPFDTGMLRDSGQVITDPTSKRIIVSYNTPYAVRQHEDLNLRHKGGRRAMWLERAAHENRERLGDYIARGMRGRI